MTGAIVLDNVTLRYGDHEVLAAVSLTMKPGRTTVVTGPNGSGKTTIARLVLGLDQPDAGRVTVAPDLTRTAVFQDNRLCVHLSAVGNVRLVLPRKRWDDARRALAAVGLDERSMSMPVRELSGGQQRRVAIARALAPGADLVVLDEPLSGIDADSKPLLLTHLAATLAGRTALFITHDLTEARAFDGPVVRLT